jgi:RHS repeat-associated protein
LQGEVYSPIRNHRGDICVLLDKDEKSVSTYRYDAFGEFTHHGEIKSPWLFSGQRYDEATKLYHFIKREYDSSTGCWLTPDPLGFADGPNLYAYVHNNPMVFVDPYGLWGEFLYSWYNNTKQFCNSFTRGVVDDTTFGASSFLLGEHDRSSVASSIGYHAGTACSLAAGFLYGGTWAKLARYGGKASINAYKFTRGVTTASTATKTTMETRNVVKLAQEAKPMLNSITKTAEKSNILVPKGGATFKLDLDALSRAGQVMDRGGLTRAGRALDKHGNRIRSSFAKATGNPVSKNAQGQYYLDNILTHPDGVVNFRYHRELGEIIDIKVPNLGGARFNRDGKMIGLLEP